MVEAGGVGIRAVLDNAQLIEFISRQKPTKPQIRLTEVHSGYTVGLQRKGTRGLRGAGIEPTTCNKL
jgi:hypothetical protein